jgi:hypothetical protein
VNKKAPYPAILIYGAFLTAVWSILWPELENNENQCNGSPSQKGNLFSNSPPPQCVFYNLLKED